LDLSNSPMILTYSMGK